MSDFINVPEIFGSDVFNEATMKQRLSPEIYCAWKECIQNSTPLNLEVARLRRIAVGSVKLGMLQTGEWRDLTPEEVEKLLVQAGVKKKGGNSK